MRKLTVEQARAELRDGLRFTTPIYAKPSLGIPFRAVVEAAGIPGESEGKGRLTRKRFMKLVMSTGNGRRQAEALAFAAKRKGMSYRECLRLAMVPAILRSDKAVRDLEEDIRAAQNMHTADPG